MEQFFVQKNVFKNNIHTKLDINEEIFEAVLKQIFFIFWITWSIVPSCTPEKLEGKIQITWITVLLKFAIELLVNQYVFNPAF